MPIKWILMGMVREIVVILILSMRRKPLIRTMMESATMPTRTMMAMVCRMSLMRFRWTHLKPLMWTVMASAIMGIIVQEQPTAISWMPMETDWATIVILMMTAMALMTLRIIAH